MISATPHQPSLSLLVCTLMLVVLLPLDSLVLGVWACPPPNDGNNVDWVAGSHRISEQRNLVWNDIYVPTTNASGLSAEHRWLHRRHRHRRRHGPTAETNKNAATVVHLCGARTPSRRDKAELASVHAAWDESEAKTLFFRESAANRTTPTTILRIPVYFHVFQWSNTVGNVSNATLRKGFLTALNAGFRDTPFQFVFRGATHTVNRKWFQCLGQRRYKPSLRQGGNDALNVYVCDTVGGLGVGGDSYFPFIRRTKRRYLDGVRILHPALNGGIFAAAQILVHEVGHWLGLLHTFEGGCETSENYHYGQYRSYYFAGDGVRDTPAHAVPTLGRKTPSRTPCWQGDQIDTCPKNRTGSDPGLDPVDNYMNYLTPSCYYWYGRFTPGQVDRMVAQYHAFRKPRPRRKTGGPSQ